MDTPPQPPRAVHKEPSRILVEKNQWRKHAEKVFAHDSKHNKDEQDPTRRVTTYNHGGGGGDDVGGGVGQGAGDAVAQLFRRADRPAVAVDRLGKGHQAAASGQDSDNHAFHRAPLT
mgnify:CR=1 FL=1